VQLFTRRGGGHPIAAPVGLDGEPHLLVVLGRGDGAEVTRTTFDDADVGRSRWVWDVTAPGCRWTGYFPELELVLDDVAVTASTQSYFVDWSVYRGRRLSWWKAVSLLDWSGGGYDASGLAFVDRAWGSNVPFAPARLVPGWHRDLLFFDDDHWASASTTGRGREKLRVDVHGRRGGDGGCVPQRWTGRTELAREDLHYSATASTPVAQLVPGGGVVGFDFEGQRGDAAVRGTGVCDVGGRPR
jgi:hypothetical protein